MITQELRALTLAVTKRAAFTGAQYYIWDNGQVTPALLALQDGMERQGYKIVTCIQPDSVFC